MIECRDGRCAVSGPINVSNVVAVLGEGKDRFTAPATTVDLAGVT
jgi:hypothetical protein